MEQPLVSISVNLVLILRVFGGLSWGFLWAAFIQWNRWGQFLVEERTWLTVLIGIGIDLVIAYPGDWWVVFFVIAASSIGIIARSLWNESVGTKGKRLMPNRSQWSLDDIAALAMSNIEILQTLMANTEDIQQKLIKPLSALLLNNHRISDKVKDVRAGVHKPNA